MDDISAIAGLTTSLRAAVEIMKAMDDISDSNLIPTKIFELTREIMSAQACALAVQSEQFDLLQSKRGLEEEIVRLKTWSTEKYRYELKNVGPGAVAYVVKANMQGSEPAHWICANCFQSGKKRFLNESHSDLNFVYHKDFLAAGTGFSRLSRQHFGPLARHGRGSWNVVCGFGVSKLLKLPCETHDLIGVALFDLCAMVVPPPVPRPLRMGMQSGRARRGKPRARRSPHPGGDIAENSGRRHNVLRPEQCGKRRKRSTEFLLFGFQSAVIFLNIFSDLICDPKKF
jgi:hypothetical protein